MSGLSYQIDNIGDVLRGVAPLSRQPPQVTQLLAHAMSLVERDQYAALAVMRRASALASRAIVFDENVKASTRGGLAPWQAERIRLHIEKNCTRRIHSQELAKIARLSTSYFSTAFRSTFGTSPADYVSRLRADRAMHLMVDTDNSLSQIALDCGFADQSHLSRVFRRITMHTPAAWRRAARAKANGEALNSIASRTSR